MSRKKFVASDFLQKIAHRTHVNGVGEGAVSIRLTTSLHKKTACCGDAAGRFFSIGVCFPKRNAPIFRITACRSEETGRISRFGRVARKKLGRIPDLGALL